MTKSFQIRQLAAATIGAAALFHGVAVQAAAVVPKTLGSVDSGQTISATHNGLSKNGYSDNPDLMNSAWAHAGGSPWYSFQVLTTTDVSLALTPKTAGANFNPGLTVWATGSSAFNGGSDNIEEGTNNGWGAPHSFNATGQVGDDGTLWMSGANGNVLQTLAYAVTGPAHTDAANNGWAEVINSGVNDVSIDNTFEQGVTGTATGNSIQLNFNQLKAGWYVAYFNGTNSALTNTAYNFSVTAAPAVPEPSTWLLMLAGLGVAAAMRRRQA
jgi:hypothetical protein